MKVVIENGRLVGSIEILEKLELAGLKAIHRTRLANKLIENLKRVEKEVTQLKEGYAEKDEKGEVVIKEDRYEMSDENREKLSADLEKFYKEKVVIDSGDSPVFLQSVKQSLEESEVKWHGKDQYNFVYLYEALITNKKEEEVE